MASLKVFDSRGRLVPPTRTGGTASADSVSVPCALSLDPGKPTKLYFDDPSGWIDIRFWGYSITHPGSYTLVVRPNVDRFASADNDVRTQDSNKCPTLPTWSELADLADFARSPRRRGSGGGTSASVHAANCNGVGIRAGRKRRPLHLR